MAIQDTERILRAVRDILKADLSSKLTAITAEYATEDAAEYGGSVTLEPIPDANYYMNFPPMNLNQGIWIVYGVDAITPTSAGPYTAKEYSIFVALGHTGLKNDSSHNRIESKLLRYTRAIKDVLTENFDQVLSGYSSITVAELPAQPELQLETGETLRVSGLVFSANVV